MRIKQILIDSGLMDSIGEYAYEEDNWEPVVTKFAELIVKECVNVGYKAWLKDNSTVPTFPSRQIKQHFDIKE